MVFERSVTPAEEKRLATIRHQKIQQRIVRKCYPALHLKTHYKAATSILMEDTKTMKIDKGGDAQEVLQLALDAKDKEVRGEEAALKRHISGKYGLLSRGHGSR